VKNANLALRFGLELTALAIAAWWGATTGSGGWEWILAILAPLVVIVAWGWFVAPRRKYDLPRPARLGVELLVWLAATAALVDVGHPVLAAVFLVVALTSGALNARWS